jgi:Lon protease-like protein
MDRNPFTPDFNDLPATIAVFPLTGVLLLPGGQLPLNIFEKRYLAMVEDVLSSKHRIMGMIQPKEPGSAQDFRLKPELCRTGCAGKIIDFSETSDGRYLITLQGICRFDVESEMDTTTLYRQIRPEWKPYARDVLKPECTGLEREKLHTMLEQYFRNENLNCDWGKVEEASDESLITCLSMICPFEPLEKQALLEAPCCSTRAAMFMTMLDMAIKAHSSMVKTQH